jgi:hypothetical protein
MRIHYREGPACVIGTGTARADSAVPAGRPAAFDESSLMVLVPVGHIGRLGEAGPFRGPHRGDGRAPALMWFPGCGVRRLADQLPGAGRSAGRLPRQMQYCAGAAACVGGRPCGTAPALAAGVSGVLVAAVDSGKGGVDSCSLR